MIEVYKPSFETGFKKKYKKILHGSRYKKEDFTTIYYKLLCAIPLEDKYNDHFLTNRKPERELHVKLDWLLIYKYDGDTIKFIDTGSHSDLFG